MVAASKSEEERLLGIACACRTRTLLDALKLPGRRGGGSCRPYMGAPWGVTYMAGVWA